MSTTIKRYLFILISIISLNSCEDQITFIPDAKSALQYFGADYRSTFKDLNNSIYEFEFDPIKDAGLTFPDESNIMFQANSFQYEDGNKNLTCQKVKARITFIRTQKEMVANQIGTNATENRSLVSGGMVDVHIYCGDKELMLIPGKNYTLRLTLDQANFKDEFEMFYGVEKEFGTVWEEADNDPNVQNNIQRSEWRSPNTGGVFEGIICFPEKLKWVNCDYFTKFKDLDKTEPCIKATIANVGDTIKLISYCVFKNLNIVIAPCCNPAGTEEVCFGPIPIGEDVEYIIVGKGKVDYYLGHVRKLVEKNEHTSIQVNKSTLDEIKMYISTL
ncbi:MAG: hypothetical protein WBB17_13620 [Saprospiraceae bacterium]